MPPAARRLVGGRLGRSVAESGFAFPRRMVEQAAAGNILRQQRLNLPSEFLVLPASFRQVSGPLFRLPLTSRVVQRLDLPPALGVHGCSPSPKLYIAFSAIGS